MEDGFSSVVILAGIGVFAAFFILLVISKLLLICHPNEVIVLSGRKRTLPSGDVVGYRLIRGGRAVRIPLIEKAARMSLETIPLDLTIQNAYSKGGIPLIVDAIANVKVDSNEPTFGNAVERFLGRNEEEIHQIAKDTLEGNLRGVLATLTPEEVNEDRLKFAQSLIEEADNDLQQLGLQLDTLKITNISDDAGYLDSIGRRKTAEVISEARKAEAEKTAEAEETEAISRRNAELVKAKSEQEIRNAQIEANKSVQVEDARANQTIEEETNNLRVKKAELERIAIEKEKQALVAGEKAEAKYRQELEDERIILQRKKLEADVIEPARAEKEAQELRAIGEAAKIRENGEAQLAVVKEMIARYKEAGKDGEKIFVLNMLPDIIEQLVSTVSQVEIDKLSIIDNGGGSGGGSGISNIVNQMPGAVLTLAETLNNATGIDILGIIKDTASGRNVEEFTDIEDIIEFTPATDTSDDAQSRDD